MKSNAAWRLAALVLSLAVCGTGHAEDTSLPVTAQVARPGALQLTLQDALRRAARSNLALRRGRYDEPMARQGLIAADAAFDRLLTAGIELRRAERPSTASFFGTDPIRDDSVGVYTGVSRRMRDGSQISMMYRLDRFDTTQPLSTINPAWQHGLQGTWRVPLGQGRGWIAQIALRRAENNMVRARALQQTSLEDVLQEVIAAYWELAYAQRNLAQRYASEHVAQELVEVVESRIRAEVATPLDAADARAGLARRRSDRLVAEQARESAVDRLLLVMQPFRPGVDAPDVVATDPLLGASRVPADAPASRFVALAMQGRPELRTQRATIAGLGLDVMAARDTLRPQLDLVASAQTTGYRTSFDRSLREAVGGDILTVGIGLEFSYAIGQRAAKARWRQAAWARHQAALALRSLESQIIGEVRRGLRALRTADAVAAASRVERDAAEEALAGERRRLKEGKSTPFRVLEKEEAVSAAGTREARAAADRRIAETGLWRATGSLAQRLGIQAQAWAPCPRFCTPRR